MKPFIIGIDISTQTDITVYAIKKADGSFEVLSKNLEVVRDAEKYLNRSGDDFNTRPAKGNARSGQTSDVVAQPKLSPAL
jgi:altronate dehydratase